MNPFCLTAIVTHDNRLPRRAPSRCGAPIDREKKDEKIYSGHVDRFIVDLGRPVRDCSLSPGSPVNRYRSSSVELRVLSTDVSSTDMAPWLFVTGPMGIDQPKAPALLASMAIYDFSTIAFSRKDLSAIAERKVSPRREPRHSALLGLLRAVLRLRNWIKIRCPKLVGIFDVDDALLPQCQI